MLDRRSRYLLWALGLIVAMSLLAACNSGWEKTTEPFKDAPRGDDVVGEANVGNMPDGFSNWAAKCDGTTRVYTIYHSNSPYGGIAVSPNHPKCGGGR